MYERVVLENLSFILSDTTSLSHPNKLANHGLNLILELEFGKSKPTVFPTPFIPNNLNEIKPELY